MGGTWFTEMLRLLRLCKMQWHTANLWHICNDGKPKKCGASDDDITWLFPLYIGMLVKSLIHDKGVDDDDRITLLWTSLGLQREQKSMIYVICEDSIFHFYNHVWRHGKLYKLV